MTLETKLFILISDIILSLIFYIFLYRLKKNVLKITLTILIILFFGFFVSKVWEFKISLFLLIYILPPIIIASLLALIPKKEKDIIDGFFFIYQTSKGLLIFKNPFRGFSLFGGAGSGKTKSITKPTIENCARLNVSGIIYDYKKFDLTRCAITQYKKHNSNVKLQFANFFDPKYSQRVNPVSPEVLQNAAYASQASATLMRNLVEKSDESNDKFFLPTAEAALAGIMWRLKEDFQKNCNLPIAAAISLNKNTKEVIKFISRNRQASLIAAPFLQSESSDRQLAGVAGTLSGALRKIALPQIFYTLSGNDFSLDLNDPKEPKLLCISNYQELDDVYSPVIALIINMALKRMNHEGKHPSIILMEEGTTLRIPNFDNIPASARENKIITFFICQDMVQGEGAYGRIGRDKILSNLANQFFGLVRNPETAQYYSKIFGKVFEEHKSKTQKQGDLFTSSVTTSERLVDKYPPQLFQNLNSGEFYGIFADANHLEFNGKFKMYDEIELPMSIQNYVSEREINDNFNDILNKAQSIIYQ